jgi:hypothetical protein
MDTFPSTVWDETEEERYQSWLEDHRKGLVVSGDGDESLTVHAVDCNTLSYDLKSASQSKRTRKRCFRDSSEFIAWEQQYYPGGINVCGRCMKSDRT